MVDGAIESLQVTESPTMHHSRQQTGFKNRVGKGNDVRSGLQQAPPDSSDMLQLLTNTTIHLQSEAERLAKSGTNSIGVSRKSRDSNKYLQQSSAATSSAQPNNISGGAINSHRSQFTNNVTEDAE